MFALQKSMESIVKTEWKAVKNVPSLFKHYGSQKEYQKWRERFVRAGYLAKNQRKQRRSKADTRAYNRAYVAQRSCIAVQLRSLEEKNRVRSNTMI